jgi:hypothetical protein
MVIRGEYSSVAVTGEKEGPLALRQLLLDGNSWPTQLGNENDLNLHACVYNDPLDRSRRRNSSSKLELKLAFIIIVLGSL